MTVENKAFQYAFEAYTDTVYRVAVHNAPTRTDVEDAVQEVFEKLLLCKKEFADEELTELLTATMEPNRAEEDQYELLQTGSGPNHTWGLLRYQGTYPYLDALILGSFDNTTKEPLGETQLIGGDRGVDYLTFGSSFGLHFLCTGLIYGQGPEEYGNAAIFTIWEAARQFFEDYSEGYSDSDLLSCEHISDYRDPDYPDAMVYRIIFGYRQGATLDYYFLFDGNDKLLGVRSTPEFSLNIGGTDYALGTGTKDIFGTPSSTNLVPETEARSIYSEWFGSDYGNSTGYSYYLERGTYYLSTLNTVREDVYTARGIHVGNTVAELVAAYPEASWSPSPEASSFSYYVTGPELTFYFNPADSVEDALSRKIIAITLTDFHGYWPEA